MRGCDARCSARRCQPRPHDKERICAQRDSSHSPASFDAALVSRVVFVRTAALLPPRLRGSAAPRLRCSARRAAARCGGAAQRGAVARPGDAAARRCGVAVRRCGSAARQFSDGLSRFLSRKKAFCPKQIPKFEPRPRSSPPTLRLAVFQYTHLLSVY